MFKKIILLAIALMVVGLAVVPQVQAQTKQQQQELEQIAKRSMKGLSPQDRQRVVQIMTDMFVAQGMSKQQAAALAEANADTLFLTDIGGMSEMTPEQRKQFEEQERRLAEMDKPLPERIAAAQREAGRNPGWPAASAFSRYGFTIGQPKDLGDPVFSWVKNGDELTIYIEAKGGYSLKPEEMFFSDTVLQKVERLVASVAGKFDNNLSNDSYRYYERPDPKRKNTSTDKYWIHTVVEPGRTGGKLAGIIIILKMGEAHGAQ